jgi:hypothetical protein
LEASSPDDLESLLLDAISRYALLTNAQLDALFHQAQGQNRGRLPKTEIVNVCQRVKEATIN